MAAHFLSSPQTERNDYSRYEKTGLDVSFSQIPSFMSPVKPEDEIIAHMRVNNGAESARTLATPRTRNALGERRNPPGKAEFTPLLKSATQNRLKKFTENGDAKENELRTPAALKPGFKLDGTPLPEPSEFSSSSVVDEEGTPIAVGASSSVDLSTPLALPKRGEGEVIESGNVLTLKEQELRLEQIDKENFGLKLKIHFLEENLKRSGPEANQIAIRENSELKSNKLLLERELKRYQKSLKIADHELEQYKQQLLDYVDKVKRRHLSETMQEEMEQLRRGAEERDAQLRSMQEKLDQTRDAEEEAEKLRGELEDAELELRQKDELLQKQEEELQDLRSKANSGDDETGELEEKERMIQEQADQLDELQDELRRTTQEKDAELDDLEDRLQLTAEEKDAAVNDLQKRLDASEDARREAEASSGQGDAGYAEELDELRKRLRTLEQDKNDEIESLEARLRLTESNGDNQAQLAQQAAHDVREQLKRTNREKDAEISDLKARLALVNDAQSELEDSKKQALKSAEEAANLHQSNDIQLRELQSLKDQLEAMEREANSLQSTISERDIALQELEHLRTIRTNVSEREQEIARLQRASDAQELALEDLKAAKSTISDQERQLETLKKTLQERTAELEILRQTETEPDSQLEAVQNIVREHDQDLESLRETANAMEGKLEEAHKVANERLAALETAKNELSTTKQMLEDEIQVLESSLDDAEQAKDDLQAKVEALEMEIKVSYELQNKAAPLEKELRTTQREKAGLQEELKGLEKDLDVADKERMSLQSDIQSSTQQVQTLRQASSKQSPGRLERQAKELKELQTLLKATTLDLEMLRTRLAEKEARIEAMNVETASLLKEKDRKLRTMQQAQQTSKTSAQRQVQETQTLQLQLADLQIREADLIQLRDEIIDGERKHAAEIKGLARQIQWLRARGARDEGFREALCYEKRWLMMQIGMYGACNKEHLRLIQDMGITPDASFHDRRPRLKTVGLTIIACLRVRRRQQEWAANRKLHESLMRKLEGMRKQGLRRNGAVVR